MAVVSRVLELAERTGRIRGLNGRSGAWLGIWVAAAGFRQLRRFFEEEPVVVRETLRPGQKLVITHYAKGQDPPAPLATLGRRARKKALKQAKKAAKRGTTAEGGSITAEVVSIEE